MKAILMSIQSKHLVNILNGDKTIELRKRFPKDYRGWVYLYCTKGHGFLHKGWRDGKRFLIAHKELGYFPCINGKVVCRFLVDKVEEITLEDISENEQYKIVFENHTTKETEDKLKSMCLTFDEFLDYHLKSLAHKKDGFVVSKAIHISKLEIFDKPKELSEFYKRLGCSNCTGIDTCPNPKRWGDRLTKAPQSWQYIYIKEDK